MALLVLALQGPAQAEDNFTYSAVIAVDRSTLEEHLGKDYDLDQFMAQAVEIAESRLEDREVSRYNLVDLGEGKLRLELSMDDAPEVARDAFEVRGELSLLLVDSEASAEQAERGVHPPGTEIFEMADGSGPIVLKMSGGISGYRFTGAQPARDIETHEPILSLSLDETGAKRLAKLTTEHIGERMAIVYDGKALIAPYITEPLRNGEMQISGSFSEDETNALAIQMRTGMLPSLFVILEECALRSCERD
ncbi:MAG: hypothetical protein ABJP70_04050 [Erythrobacter sp.]